IDWRRPSDICERRSLCARSEVATIGSQERPGSESAHGTLCQYPSSIMSGSLGFRPPGLTSGCPNGLFQAAFGILCLAHKQGLKATIRKKTKKTPTDESLSALAMYEFGS